MRYKIIHFFFVILFPAISFAQTIEVQLPFYAGREYYLCLPEGARQDTIATGVLNTDGNAKINLPTNYRSVGHLSIQGYGHICNVILNAEKRITISAANSQQAEITIGHSPENNFFVGAMAQQKDIISRYNSGVANTHTPFISIEQEYESFGEGIRKSKLYAARILEILNSLAGIGSSFNVSQEEILQEQHNFIVNKVDFNDLHASGFWKSVFEVWVQTTSANDSLLLNDARHILDRCGSDIHIRREATQIIIQMFSKYSKDALLAELGVEYLTMPLNGQLAPEIVMGEDSFLPKNSLIIFYETGCGSCHYELEQLKEKSKLLSNNNLRIISIAADTGKEVHLETSGKLPWTDKICDFKGFNGDNFQNYGIVGTPTYVLTDSRGIVRGRYARLNELLK